MTRDRFARRSYRGGTVAHAMPTLPKAIQTLALTESQEKTRARREAEAARIKKKNEGAKPFTAYPPEVLLELRRLYKHENWPPCDILELVHRWGFPWTKHDVYTRVVVEQVRPRLQPDPDHGIYYPPEHAGKYGKKKGE